MTQFCLDTSTYPLRTIEVHINTLFFFHAIFRQTMDKVIFLDTTQKSNSNHHFLEATKKLSLVSSIHIELFLTKRQF